jgi:hypothetical protein
MSVDHSQKHYYATESTGDPPTWRFRVYHDDPTDPTGDTEVVVHRSGWDYDSHNRAVTAAVEWCKSNGVDAELD